MLRRRCWWLEHVGKLITEGMHSSITVRGVPCMLCAGSRLCVYRQVEPAAEWVWGQNSNKECVTD